MFTESYTHSQPQTTQRYASRIQKEKSVIYGLWLTQSDQRKAYVVILVDPAKHQSFERLLQSNNSGNLDDYGMILYKNWTEPSDEFKNYLRDTYGLYA